MLVAGELLDFIIFLIIVCVLAAVILWAVGRFFPAIFEPAKFIVGAFALIAILVKLKPLITSMF